MKIFDCFNYAYEEIALDIRLNILYPFVYKFIIIESEETFTGINKGFNFEKIKHKYSQFLDKIIYIKLQKAQNDTCKGFVNWTREFNQKNSFYYGLEEANDNDLILCGDIDEIPDLSNVILNDIKEPHVFINQMFIYRLNLQLFNNQQTFENRKENVDTTPNTPYRWYGSVLTPKKFIKPYQFYGGENLRNKRNEFKQLNFGWHWTYLYSDIETIILKNKSFSHADSHNQPHINTEENILDCINNNREFFNCGRDIKKVEITKENGYNDYIINNLDKFKDLIV